MNNKLEKIKTLVKASKPKTYEEILTFYIKVKLILKEPEEPPPVVKDD